jgi:phage terminase large subunit-like protein
LPPTQSTNSGQPGSVRDIRKRTAAQSPYRVIQPNSKPQTQFLSTDADIALYGGANGGGKTFALELEPTRHLLNPGFGAVFLRRTLPEIKQEDGAWDVSQEIYYGLGGFPNFSELKWYFPSGATIKFAAIQHEKDIKEKWGSSQIGLILVDQAETFSGRMFWGLIGRNRATYGIRPYIRMGCNPDPDSWLAEFIAWWLDDDGYAIPERSGVIRYFLRWGETIYWADTAAELIERFRRPGSPDPDPLSFTFIPAKLSDNVDLEAKDPKYRARLEAQPLDERLRTLGDEQKGGNWKIKIGSGMFPAAAWRLIDRYDTPAAYVRYWDTAATDYGDLDPSRRGASTAGVLMAFDSEGPVVLDVVEDWVEGAARDELIKRTAELDQLSYGHVVQWFEQEPGGSGKTDAKANLRLLLGIEAYAEPATGDKVIRARPWSSTVQSRLVRVLKRDWTKGYIDQHTSFPLSKRKDKVDASSGCFSKGIDLKPIDSTGVIRHNIPNAADRLGPGVFG